MPRAFGSLSATELPDLKVLARISLVMRLLPYIRDVYTFAACEFKRGSAESHSGTAAITIHWAAMDEPILDCLIVGGGPAGLTAAIYLARFHLDILVVDGGKSRAAWIPCTRNVSGFPEGIEGTVLLQRMRDQTCKYGAKVESEFVSKLERDATTGLFTATWGSGCRSARTVLLATGVANRRPPMDEQLHEDALARGLIRYCPICDGYEVTDKKIGVIGSDSHGVAEALFIRSYTADVTLIAPDKALRLNVNDSEKLKAAGIGCVDGPAEAVAITGDCIVVDTADGDYAFDG